MTTLTAINPETLAARIKARAATLIDIREPDEYAREHIDGAISLPLSRLEEGKLTLETHGDVVLHCKSGLRTNSNCARLSGHVDGEAFMLEGGPEAWKRAGLPVRTNERAPLEMNRQVQIAAGGLALLGTLAGVFVHPAYLIVPAGIGAGLTFAGVTGWCGLAHLLALAPWNKRAA